MSAELLALLQNAVRLHQAGRLIEAEQGYRKVIEQDRRNADALHLLGLVAQQSGRKQEAVQLIGEAIGISGAVALYRSNLASLLTEIGRPEDALAACAAALCLSPDLPEAHYNRGNALLDLGRADEALAASLTALRLRGDYPKPHNNRGRALWRLERPGEALSACETALAVKPDYAEAHVNRGNALMALGRPAAALDAFDAGLRLRPDMAEAHYARGNILRDFGRTAEALAAYDAALGIKADFVEAHTNRGNCLKVLGRLDQALAAYEAASRFAPDRPEPHYNRGNVLASLGRGAEALAAHDAALKAKPDFAEAHNNRGNALKSLVRIGEALTAYERSVCLRPDFAEAFSNRGNGLKDIGRSDEALAAYDHALRIKPGLAEARSSVLFMTAASGEFDPDAYLRLARQWEINCVPPSARLRERLPAAPLSGRRLRVGYVSGDFRRHPVSQFIEQLWQAHDRGRIELFAYGTSAEHDEVTGRLRGLADHWAELTGLDDDAARARIEADGIDVLVDLSGHTTGNRLGVFARRAAPVQTHYLGFFGSTGLSRMDYWIGDDCLTPPELDRHFTETVWRLPRIWVCYQGDQRAPPTEWSPGKELCLGSFNRLSKITPLTIALWARVLLALPRARLLLKTPEFADPAAWRPIVAAFAGHGVAEDRLELLDRQASQSWASHMALYDRLDIALDPVGGVSGGTTTCEALWMGAPTIALAGDRMANRMSASMLNAIGRAEWIAQDEADYVAKVVALARDVEGRALMRRDQRARMAASPLCDGVGLARALEDAYVAMFSQAQSHSVSKQP